MSGLPRVPSGVLDTLPELFDQLSPEETAVALWMASPEDDRCTLTELAASIGRDRKTVYRIIARPHVEAVSTSCRRVMLTVRHLPDLWETIFTAARKDEAYALRVGELLLKNGIHPFFDPRTGAGVQALDGSQGSYERVILERGRR